MSESHRASLQEEEGQNSERKWIQRKMRAREIQGENIAEAITEAEILSL